jgi:hypothetical protein
MLIMPRISSLVAASLLIAGTALAQSTATAAIETMGTNPNPPGQSKSGSTAMKHKRIRNDASQSTATAPGTMTSSSSTGSSGRGAMGGMTAGAGMHHKSTRSHSGSNKGSVWNDATRLEALLTDAQTNVNVDGNSWKRVGNEANALADRIYAHASGNPTARSAAGDLRTHVRELRGAAMKGDAAGVRTHAGLALPYAYKLVDWSTPAAGSKRM